MASLTFKVLSSSARPHMSNLIQAAVPFHPLQSSNAILLSILRMRIELTWWAFSLMGGKAHWHNLMNVIEPSICCSDAALCQITLTDHLLLLLLLLGRITVLHRCCLLLQTRLAWFVDGRSFCHSREPCKND